MSRGSQDKKPLTGHPSIDKPWLKYYDEEARAQALAGEGKTFDSIDALMDDLHA